MAYALVDDEDHRLLGGFKWFRMSTGYVARTLKNPGRTILLHRAILWAPDGYNIDHANGDKLDNRRANIRVASPTQNSLNKGASSRSTSGLKGAYPVRGRNLWRSTFQYKGRVYHLGYYKTPEEAAKAHDDFANKKDARFNKPNDV